MRMVVLGNSEEMTAIFFDLLRETSVLLHRSSGEEDRTQAQLLLFAAAVLAQTFDSAYPGENRLYKQFEGKARLTFAAQTRIFSDASLAEFLAQGLKDLTDPLSATGLLERNLLSIAEAGEETPEARFQRMLEEEAARARQQQEAALEEQRKQREPPGAVGPG